MTETKSIDPDKNNCAIMSDESKGIYSWTQSKTVIKDSLTVRTAFKTGAGNKIRFLDSNNLQIRVPPDPAAGNYKDPKGYDYFFHFDLENKGDKLHELNIELLRPTTKSDINTWFSTQAPLFCSDDGKDWYLLSNVKATKGHRDYKFPLTILPGQKIHIANSIPINPSYVKEHLISISSLNPSICSYHEIGTSVLGEPLPLLQINSNSAKKKDRFLIWAGIHASEPDTLATFWLIDWLLSDDEYARKVLEKFSFDVVPMINPDGFILGTSGCNSYGVNIFWDFRKEDNLKSPESTALWKWAQENPPQVVLDIHAYIYQVHKPARYYIETVLSHGSKLRKVAWSAQQAVLRQLNGQALVNDCKNSFSTYLKKDYDTLTFPGYHLRFLDGPTACKQLIIETIKSIYLATTNHKPLYSLANNNSRKSYNSISWRLFEILNDRAPRQIRKRLFPPSFDQRKIDDLEEWKRYIYLSENPLPVATVSSGKIF